MKRYLLIFTIVLLTSCSGTKKISEHKKEVLKDTLREVVKVSKIDSTVSNKVVSVDENEDVYYEPINKSYPMYIEGIPYENVVIKKSKKNKTTETTNDLKVVKEKIDSVLEQGKKSIVESNKKLYKEHSTFNYMWILVAILVLYIAYRIYEF